MKHSARSVAVFGIYLLVLGVGLVLAPGPLLAPFGLPPPQDIWGRVCGMVVGLLGVYYLLTALHGVHAFFGWTVAVRSTVILFFAAFVAAGLAPPVMLVFGAVDLAGALWTALALRRDFGKQPGALFF